MFPLVLGDVINRFFCSSTFTVQQVPHLIPKLHLHVVRFRREFTGLSFKVEMKLKLFLFRYQHTVSLRGVS